MKKSIQQHAIILILALSLAFSVSAQQKEKAMNEMWGTNSLKNSSGKQEMMDWFRKSKYAMFIHWGLVSQAASPWKGETN